MTRTSAMGLFIVGCTSALAQAPVREGPLERLVLDSFADAKAWAVAEATVEPDGEHVKVGRSSLHFGIDVNWQTGEEKYPIGWPRTNRGFDEPWQRDWTAYDFFHFWVYATTSRDSFPNEPLGLILYTPDKPRAYHRTLREIRKDEWVEIRVPVEEIPRCNEVTRIQFFISESRYRHGDRLDFYVSDLALLRYAEPTLDYFAVGQKVTFADARFLPVRTRTFGIPRDGRTRVAFSVHRGGKELATTVQQVGRGEETVWLDLGPKALAAGEYEVRAMLPGARGPARMDTFRVVASPWQEPSLSRREPR
ncbi:MAG: hypothetical protein ACE5O2_12170 [Armatimonadota bacterium]